jgi:hypothetical protein
MPKPKDQLKLQDIQSAALKLVLQTGFNSLKMADVAIEANIATGKTKKESIAAMLNPEHATGNFYTTFKNMWFGYYDFCAGNADKMLFVEQFIYSGLISQEVIADTEKSLIPLTQFLEYGQQNKILKKMDLILVISQMQGAIHETVKVLTKQGKTLQPSEIDKCFGITWDGLKYR